MNATLRVPCPEPRCRALPGENCLRLTGASFPGQRAARQSHGVRVLAAKTLATPRQVARHPGFTDAAWTDERGRPLYLLLVAVHGHGGASRLWHAACDLAAGACQTSSPPVRSYP